MRSVPAIASMGCLPRLNRWVWLLWALALGVANATAVPTVLVSINATTYQTEHCLFLIVNSPQVDWTTSGQSYGSVYSQANLSSYYTALTTAFPGNYFSICYLANNLSPNSVPIYTDRIYKASGINQPGTPGAPASFATVDYCRYNLGGNSVVVPALGVYDHEIGHAWGAQILGQGGHWLANSTVDCQLSATFSTDGYQTVNKIYGDPAQGFRWRSESNQRSNDLAVFSDQELYLLGAHPVMPTFYVLNSPVYQADHTMTAGSVTTYDHATMVATYGVRNPDYRSSPKHFKLGFVYLARDVAEVNTVYAQIEQSARQFCEGEAIDLQTYRGQVPFLADTKFRASVEGRLADLDGNHAPALVVTDTYVTSVDGTATAAFTAQDADGPAPVVSMVPASALATVQGGTVQFSGLTEGVHFFTLKAEDAGGKKAFGHVVVEVHRPAAGFALSAGPLRQTVTAGGNATFTVTPTGTTGAVHYDWRRQARGTSTWEPLAEGAVYTGTATAQLTVLGATTPMQGDAFLCLVSDDTGAVTSGSAELTVNEAVPGFSTQPVTQTVPPGQAAHFSVQLQGTSASYGYVTYQWQKLPVGTATWADLSGAGYINATSAALTVSGAGVTLAHDGDQFRCVVGNTAGTVISDAVALVIKPAPVITSFPSPVTTNAGQTATFSVVASSALPVTYQWFKGSAINGATSDTLVLANVQAADAGYYWVQVTSAVGSVISSNYPQLIVVAAPPTISNPPAALTVAAGQAAVFSVTATGTEPMTYQWRKNGTAIPGATNSTYTLPVTHLTDAADYDVIVTNVYASASHTVTSATAALQVTPSFVSWQEAHFTPTELADAAISGPTSSYGGAAGSNLLKYALGLSPGVAVVNPTSLSLVAGEWVLTYVRPAAVTDLVYSVEVSDDLQTWSTTGVTHEHMSTNAGQETWQGRCAASPAGKLFFRLKVVLP